MTTVEITWTVDAGDTLLDMAPVVARLTTEHAASSHGLPVVVVDVAPETMGGRVLTTFPLGARGPAETPAFAFRATESREPTADEVALLRRAREAGYQVLGV